MCEILHMVHKLIGCDVTSKIGTKQAALKYHFSQLVDFGSTDLPDLSTLLLAGGYYVQCFLQRIIARHLIICSTSCTQKRKHHFHLCHLPHGCYTGISCVATTLFADVKICCLIQSLTLSQRGIDGAWLNLSCT